MGKVALDGWCEFDTKAALHPSLGMVGLGMGRIAGWTKSSWARLELELGAAGASGCWILDELA